MNPLSISQLTEKIKLVLESELEPVYWVVGEMADFRVAPQGHAYFELVEKQGNQVLAKIKANLWQFNYRSVAAKFENITGTSLKNGMKVLAQISVGFHSVYGMSINVKDIDPSFSLGERARLRQETIDRLTREGLIRLNGRFELPPVVQRIAVISSATAAGYGDFVNQLENNPYGYQVYHQLFNSLMQGNEAVSSLIFALEQVESQITQQGLEAVVIIRGGGAQLDLDCFDDYRLGAKIANFPLPVFTGIGHERDETVADLVAHTRLKTPTAVAEFLLSGFREFEENLGLILQRLDRTTQFRIKEEDSKIQHFSLRTKALAVHRLSLESERVKTLGRQTEQACRNLIRMESIALDSLEKNLKKTLGRFVEVQAGKLDHLEQVIKQMDPEVLLKKGYTRTESQGKPVHLVNLSPGDTLLTHTFAQKISSTITQIEEK
ncbi:exodeoxyribonuclease VII large subunit [Algoriphagus sp. AK58]|uniref:exodeoxyribonuclease VII large subunit n=1 Tax=Algoriphagus sp. AK58 TaxID=1406877 RepID=UPI00165011DA|nr:exodeoxyribonuclease VII large subunit [Algoriphagus sp. AK58]MBC6368491.1 exodeoxyribonuclease VII large subunit [Algoriphagus sp. AK58]